MKTYLDSIRKDLKAAADPALAESNKRFFKVGEHFLCYGMKGAEANRVIKKYVSETKDLCKDDILALCEALWQSGYQEETNIACALSEKLGSVSEPEDFDIYANCLNRYVSNWAMCDTLCNHTIGDLVMKYPELAERLFDWTSSDNRWVKRGSAVTLSIPARRGLYLSLVCRIADALLGCPDDLVRKGYGWMLKAATESHEQEIFDFVIERRTIMPRTALRYAIEKMPQEKRKLAMSKGKVG